MANANRPSGLSPIGTRGAASWNGRTNVYYIISTDPNAYAVGDPVTLSGDADANGVPGVVLATAGAGNTVIGCIVSPAGSPTYGVVSGTPAETPVIIPATKTHAYYVMVSDDPMTLYTIQEDGVGGTIAAASVGLNCDLVSGANNGYVSGWLLDSSTVNSGSTRQVKVVKAVQSVDNALGANCKWIVQINNTPFGPNAAGL